MGFEMRCAVDHNGMPCPGYPSWTPKDGTAAPSQPLILDHTRPFTCPNCAGFGNVEKLHYNLAPTALVCWACGGTGIVWG